MRERLRAVPSDVLAAITGASVLAVISAAVVTARVMQPDPGVVPAGVSIGGVAVGGLTPAEAERVLRARLPAPGAEILLTTPAGEPVLPPVAVASLRPEPRLGRAIADAARRASLVQRLRREVGLGGGRDVRLTFRVDQEQAGRLALRLARRFDVPPRSASVRVRDGRFVLRQAVPGRAVDRSELVGRLAEMPDRLALPVDPVAPRISDAQAAVARSQAVWITRSPVVVAAGRRAARIGRRDLLELLRFRAEGARLLPRLDPRGLRRLLLDRLSVVERAPRSARFRVRSRRVEIVDAVPGRVIDGAAVARSIVGRRGTYPVRLRTAAVEPRLTSREARALRIREVVGEFTTPYACCQPRVVNIARAASILDGDIIPAGGTFSLNEALGERTRDRGFVPAPQINAGRLEDAVGGGVSQVATTFFNAAFFAGLRIVTHTPHEFWITRYPPGREATISWGGPELVVRNDWPAAVLVSVIAARDGITVRLFSSRLGRRVTTETIGTAIEGSAFPIVYTRRVQRRPGSARDERFTWSYRAPPPA
ncbi:MAG: VanW family protein [Thermoleophilia bacterium]